MFQRHFATGVKTCAICYLMLGMSQTPGFFLPAPLRSGTENPLWHLPRPLCDVAEFSGVVNTSLPLRTREVANTLVFPQRPLKKKTKESATSFLRRRKLRGPGLSSRFAARTENPQRTLHLLIVRLQNPGRVFRAATQRSLGNPQDPPLPAHDSTSPVFRSG